jgi:hypothetical protein
MLIAELATYNKQCRWQIHIEYIKKTLEDTKGLTRIRKSKDRQN